MRRRTPRCTPRSFAAVTAWRLRRLRKSRDSFSIGNHQNWLSRSWICPVATAWICAGRPRSSRFRRPFSSPRRTPRGSPMRSPPGRSESAVCAHRAAAACEERDVTAACTAAESQDRTPCRSLQRVTGWDQPRVAEHTLSVLRSRRRHQLRILQPPAVMVRLPGVQEGVDRQAAGVI
jgi:hypothetical protein